MDVFSGIVMEDNTRQCAEITNHWKSAAFNQNKAIGSDQLHGQTLNVSFVQQRLDSNFKSYINFNDSEWATLMEAIPAINTVLNDAMDCNVCQNLKRPIYVTKDNRMADTKLTKEQLEDIQEYNIGVQNQLGLTCTYCGVEGYMNDDCHCHRYDCRICEPDNFCTKCHKMIVYSA